MKFAVVLRSMLAWAKRMLHLGTDAGLDLLDLLGELPAGLGLVQRAAFAWAHGHVPSGALTGIRSLVGTLVAYIGEYVRFLAVHQFEPPRLLRRLLRLRMEPT